MIRLFRILLASFCVIIAVASILHLHWKQQNRMQQNRMDPNHVQPSPYAAKLQSYPLVVNFTANLIAPYLKAFTDKSLAHHYVRLAQPIDLASAHFDSRVASNLWRRGKLLNGTWASFKVQKKTNACFRPVMSEHERYRTAAALKRVVDMFMARGITFVQIDGNLLGSHRFFGQLQWEGDLDFFTLRSQRLKVRSLVQHLHNTYSEFVFRDTERSNGHLALYLLCSKTSHSLAKPWTQCGRTKIDIFFFWLNARKQYWRGNWQPYDMAAMLPHVWRPYDGVLVPSPRDSLRVIATEYGKDGLRTCVDDSCTKSKLKLTAMSPELFWKNLGSSLNCCLIRST